MGLTDDEEEGPSLGLELFRWFSQLFEVGGQSNHQCRPLARARVEGLGRVTPNFPEDGESFCLLPSSQGMASPAKGLTGQILGLLSRTRCARVGLRCLQRRERVSAARGHGH